MRREPLKYIFVAFLGFAAVIEIFLLFSGYRILLDEEYYPERPGIRGSAIYAEDAKFDCTYFTGRKMVHEELPARQYDECPFLWTRG